VSAANAAGTRTAPGTGTGTGTGKAADGGRGGRRGAIGRHVPALLREAGFRRYWCGQTISMFGDQISSIALPLVAVLTLRAGPAQMGLLAALVWLPSLLFSLHAGVLADRFGHWRALMIVADLGRAVLLASIPACYALGVLTVWQLYAVALGTGAFSVLFTVSQPTLFVSLVPGDAYLEGNSLLYGSRALSFTGGPSAGGVLVELLGAPFAVVADALSFLGSAFFLGRIHVAEPRPDEPAPGALTAGARFIKGLAGCPVVPAVGVGHQLLQLRFLRAVRAVRHPVAARPARPARPGPRRRGDRRRTRRAGHQAAVGAVRHRASLHRVLPGVHRAAGAGAAGRWP
jgi:MFS family permease